MNGSERSDPDDLARPERCAHAARARRICDVCEAAGRAYRACSLACLTQHLSAEHPELEPRSSAERAHAHANELNRGLADSWAGYAEHRQQVTALIGGLPRGAELCVLGAGNCNDLDLEQISAWFSQIHLADLDGEALERARERQSPAVRAKLRLHAELDLSGLIEHVDGWGEQFPDRAELGRSAVLAAQSIVRSLGQSFPAVVSTCVLSELVAPFERSWITSRGNWGELLNALNAIHLATLAGATRPGGQGLLLFDTATSKDTPALGAQHGKTSERLAGFIDAALHEGSLHLKHSPERLLAQLSSPGLKPMVSDATVGAPWLWRVGPDTRLVFSLRFNRISE
ncbi:MAG: hypothetical protein ABJB12_01855 [Pseudomonadota bacterium]